MTPVAARLLGLGQRQWRRVREEAALRPFSRLLLANVVNNAVAFAVSVAAARLLGPPAFALFALAVTLATVLALVVGLGQNLTLVRFYTRAAPAGRPALVQGVFAGQGVVFAALTLGLPILVPVAQRWFPPLGATGELTAAGIWTAGLLALWSSCRALDQARGDVDVYAGQSLLYALARVAAVAALLAMSGPSPIGFFVALYPAPLSVILAVSWFRRYRHLATGPAAVSWQDRWRNLRATLSYGRWVALSALLYALLFRLPQVFLSHRASRAEIGLYSAALTFLAVFSLLNDTIRVLLLPRVAGLDSDAGRRAFQRAVGRRGPLLLGALLSAVAVMAAVQWFLLGKAYHDSVPLLLVLGAAMAIAFQLGLLNMVVHAYGVPSLDAAVNLGRVVVLGGLFPFLPPTAMAASVALAAVLLGGELLLRGALGRLPSASPP